MKFSKILLLSLFGILLICPSLLRSREVSRRVIVRNPARFSQTSYPVVLKLSEVVQDLDVRNVVVICDGCELSSQLDDLDNDDSPDELVFLVDVPSNDSIECYVTFSDVGAQKEYSRCVRAYIKLYDSKEKYPEIKSITYPGDANLLDMYNSIYGHGAVFENELNAFRIYMDNRQSVDIYGKTKRRLEMDVTGFYTTAAQTEQGYGCDVLWAGQTVGAGSFRGFLNGCPSYIDTVLWRSQTILADGPIRTVVEVKDRGWLYCGHRINMVQYYTLYSGHRDVSIDIFLSDIFPDITFCTGIQKLEDQNQGFSEPDGLCGCWGNNIPDKNDPDHNEWVGLGIYVPDSNRFSIIEDNGNYLTLLQPDKQGRIHYSVAVCAEREENGFKSAQAWFDYLNCWHNMFVEPCVIIIE